MTKKVLLAAILITVFFFVLLRGKKEEEIFTFWTIQLKAPAGDLIQKNIEILKSKYPNLNVVWVDIPVSEAQKRTIAAVLGGNPPDLINLNPEFSLSLAQKNVLEYFSEDEVSEYNKGVVEKLKYGGKIYALPYYATSAVTVLNKEKFKNCNVQIKTYDDILKLKNCENPPVFGINLNEGGSIAGILNKYGINSNNLSKDLIYDVYNKFYLMNKSGLLLKDTLTINHRENIEKYMAGSAAFIGAGSNFLTMIKQNAPDVYKNSVVLPQITGSSGEFEISVMNFVIPKKAKNKKIAKEFAKLLLNYENQTELTKKTNVLPVNIKALEGEYFKKCNDDLIEQSRCIASIQLNNPVKFDFGYKNKKEINDVINNSLEILFLKGQKEFDPESLYKKLDGYIKN